MALGRHVFCVGFEHARTAGLADAPEISVAVLFDKVELEGLNGEDIAILGVVDMPGLGPAAAMGVQKHNDVVEVIVVVD
jgi:hypothetical protein